MGAIGRFRIVEQSRILTDLDQRLLQLLLQRGIVRLGGQRQGQIGRLLLVPRQLVFHGWHAVDARFGMRVHSLVICICQIVCNVYGRRQQRRCVALIYGADGLVLFQQASAEDTLLLVE